MQLKALIIDDEIAARSELKFALEAYPEIEVAGEAENATQALELIGNAEVDILFLDIDMPDISGIEVAKKIKQLKHQPAVIFVTAYDEYALDAFDLDVLDYILKPFSESRFEKTIDKIFKFVDGNDNGHGNGLQQLDKVVAQKGSKTFIVNKADISYAQAHGDYTYVFTDDDRFLCDYTLSELENKLDGFPFFRTHRSYIINMDRVSQISTMPGGNFVLHVKNNESVQVPVSRRQAKKFKSLLGI